MRMPATVAEWGDAPVVIAYARRHWRASRQWHPVLASGTQFWPVASIGQAASGPQSWPVAPRRASGTQSAGLPIERGRSFAEDPGREAGVASLVRTRWCLLIALGLGATHARADPQIHGSAPEIGARAALAAPEVAWQAALDRAGFSPGIIDGIVGPKTERAFGAFQVHVGLPVTARPDAATLAALEIDSVPAVRLYRWTAADAAEVGPAPRGWVAKSRLTRLGYKSLAELAAERGHCTRRLLAKLNPRVDLERLSWGEEVLLPNVDAPQAIALGRSLDIDLDAKVLRVLDETGSTVGMFHCSIAADRKQRPSGSSKVVTIAANPSYLFDPVNWPEVDDVDQRLVIPPGPRNPVGLCWIGLSIPGYGIHGTPEPELIGKTGSHGCIRLMNWDVLRLAKTVRVGTEVRFAGSPAQVAARR